MKKLYAELALLAIALLASVWMVEKIYSSYQTPPDSVIRTFNEQKDNVNTVLIGNSHIAALGTPTLFHEKSFNLAFSGINLFDMAMLVKAVVSKEANIKNIIIGIDYDILGLNSTKSALSLQLYRYTDSLASNSMADYIKARSNYLRSDQDFWYLFTGLVKFSNGDRPDFIPVTFKAKDDKEGCIRRAREHGSISYQEQNIERNSKLLTALIDFGKAHHLNFIFICTPKTTCYTATYLSLPRINAAKLYLDKLFNENNVMYYDMMHETTFTDDDFLDYDHLTKSGAAKLTLLLQTAIQQQH